MNNLVDSAIEPLYFMVQAICVMPIGISLARGNVPDVAVLIERLRVCQVSIRNWNWSCAPIRSYETPESVAVIASALIIEAGFQVSFVSSILVVIRVVVQKLELAAPGIKIRFILDIPLGIGNDIGRL